MPLPIAGVGRPTRPPTHKPLDLRRLMTLAGELEEALELAGAEQLSPALVEELAADLGASQAHIYVAAAMMTEIPCDASTPLRFELCVGGCQGWGAVDLLKHLLKRHAQAAEGEGVPFGIVAKRCLDKCDRAAFVRLHTPDGVAGLPEASVASLDEALVQLRTQAL